MWQPNTKNLLKQKAAEVKSVTNIRFMLLYGLQILLISGNLGIVSKVNPEHCVEVFNTSMPRDPLLCLSVRPFVTSAVSGRATKNKFGSTYCVRLQLKLSIGFTDSSVENQNSYLFILEMFVILFKTKSN